MEIVYVGPDGEGVTIAGESFKRPAIWAPKGKPVEVPDDVAKGLLKLEHVWQPVKPKSSKKES